MKRITLTIKEYTNTLGESKKVRTNVGRVHAYDGGGEAIILDAALCGTIGAMGIKALMAGEDSVWLSIFEDKPQDQQQGGYSQQPQQQPYQQQAPAMQQSQQPPNFPGFNAQ